MTDHSYSTQYHREYAGSWLCSIMPWPGELTSSAESRKFHLVKGYIYIATGIVLPGSGRQTHNRLSPARVLRIVVCLGLAQLAAQASCLSIYPRVRERFVLKQPTWSASRATSGYAAVCSVLAWAEPAGVCLHELECKHTPNNLTNKTEIQKLILGCCRAPCLYVWFVWKSHAQAIIRYFLTDYLMWSSTLVSWITKTIELPSKSFIGQIF